MTESAAASKRVRSGGRPAWCLACAGMGRPRGPGGRRARRLGGRGGWLAWAGAYASAGECLYETSSICKGRSIRCSGGAHRPFRGTKAGRAQGAAASSPAAMVLRPAITHQRQRGAGGVQSEGVGVEKVGRAAGGGREGRAGAGAARRRPGRRWPGSAHTGASAAKERGQGATAEVGAPRCGAEACRRDGWWRLCARLTIGWTTRGRRSVPLPGRPLRRRC